MKKKVVSHKSQVTSQIILFSVLCFLSSAIAGCGYTTRSIVKSSKYKTIHVDPFLNKINITNSTDAANKYRLYRPMIETDITRAINNRYLFDGSLRPVEEERADLILKGEVIDFRKEALRYDNSDNVSEYRINLVINMSLWDRLENKMLWEENSFTGDTTDFATGSQSITENTAVNNALTDLSRRVMERTVEQW